MKRKDRVDSTVYTSVTEDKDTGEVQTITTVTKVGKEPDFVKLYIDCVLTFKGLGKGLNGILIELLRYMSYADIGEDGGGQLIFINKPLKESIAKRLGISIKRVEQAITNLVKAHIFKRVQLGAYQVNPNIFGKGEWNDIRNIRATFDFGNGDICADIEKNIEDFTSTTTKTKRKPRKAKSEAAVAPETAAEDEIDPDQMTVEDLKELDAG